ncbi:MAG: TolC family protein [Bryobacterales bacterium]|nr:TolC family protein [Bryobacterales bacterium]
MRACSGRDPAERGSSAIGPKPTPPRGEVQGSIRPRFGNRNDQQARKRAAGRHHAGVTRAAPQGTGEIAVQNAKQEQLLYKLQYVQDSVEVAVRDAASALDLALQRLELARAEYDLARRLASAELERFELGDSTLFIVNQREMAAAAAQFAVVNALTDCHKATAAYRAATAVL